MTKILTAILLFLSFAFSNDSTKVLHISTIPNGVDIYLETIKPNLSKNPDYISPAFIKIPQDNFENEILISLFKEGFKDTTLKVKLSNKDTSFIIISQQPEFDEINLQMQSQLMFSRKKNNLGKKIMFSSILPFVVGAISGIVAYYEIEKTNDYKKIIENSSIKNSKKIDEATYNFKDYRHKSKIAKNTSIVGLSAGITLLTFGFILTF